MLLYMLIKVVSSTRYLSISNRTVKEKVRGFFPRIEYIVIIINIKTEINGEMGIACVTKKIVTRVNSVIILTMY